MSEILARIAGADSVELIIEDGSRIKDAPTMSPHDASYLARGLLACGEGLVSLSKPKPGSIGGDAHFPVMGWKVGKSLLTPQPALIITLLSGIELTFVMPPQVAADMGKALAVYGIGNSPPAPSSGLAN